MSTHLEHARQLYARLMAAASRSDDPRIERAFEQVRREDFLPPGPWSIYSGHGGRFVETPSADPVHLYQNVLVALDPTKNINNGEPELHAHWIGAVSPQPGEAVSHVGAGAGYYTAILSALTAPGGRVFAYELESHLAQAARGNLAPFEGVVVVEGDATELALEPSDIIYVNAGLAAPPRHWLEALNLGGRLIFPWRPSLEIATAALVTRRKDGFAFRAGGSAFFIPCSGAPQAGDALRTPQRAEVKAIRSLWLSAERQPDDTAIAVYPDVWFSTTALTG